MTVRFETDARCAIITIDRPLARNAVDGPTARLLADAFRRFDADEQLEAIALHPIEARLARFFLAAARQKDPSGKSSHVTFALPISQSELALLVGASRPKVNAALALLEAEGAIERKGQDVNCDLERLSGLGGVD